METKIKITNTIDGRILVQAPAADKFWMAELVSGGERIFLSRSDKHGGFVVMHGVFQIVADYEKMFIVVKFDYKQRKFVYRVVEGDLNKVNRKYFDLKQEALRGYCVPRYKSNIDVLWNNRTTNEFLPPAGGGIGRFGYALKYLIEGGELEVHETTLECVVDALYWFKDIITAAPFHKEDTYVAVFYCDNSGEEYEEYSFKDTELVCRIAKLIDGARDEFGELEDQEPEQTVDDILGAPVATGVQASPAVATTTAVQEAPAKVESKPKAKIANSYLLSKGLYYFKSKQRWFVLSTKGIIFVLSQEPVQGCTLKQVRLAADKEIIAGQVMSIQDKYIVCGVLRSLHDHMPKNWFTRVAHKFGFKSSIIVKNTDNFIQYIQHTESNTTSVAHVRRKFKVKDKTTGEKASYVELRVIDLGVELI